MRNTAGKGEGGGSGCVAAESSATQQACLRCKTELGQGLSWPQRNCPVSEARECGEKPRECPGDSDLKYLLEVLSPEGRRGFY